MRVLVALLTALVVCQVAIYLTTVYLHRVLAHRAMTVRAGVAWPMRAVLWLTTGLKPRQWVAVHRKHHASTDEPGDPHSPVLVGYWAVQLNNAGLYRRALRSEDIVGKYAKDLAPDRWDRALFDHGWLGLAVGIGLLYVIFGWELALIASVAHAVSYLYLSAMINAVGHTYGSRPYGGASTNNQWLAWLTGGEGLHNNHHAAPTSARFSLAKGELDPGWWVVRALRGFGLATVRHDEAKVRLPTAA